MNRKKIIVLFLGLSLTFLLVHHVFSQESTVKKPIRLSPKMRVMETALTKPKIVMERAKLESPEGMKIYRFQVQPINQELLRRFTADKTLKVSPMTIQKKNPGTENLYLEKQTNATRLITNETRGHMFLLPNVERLSKAKVTLMSHEAAFNKALTDITELKLIPEDVSRATPKKIVTLSALELPAGQQQGTTKDILQAVQFDRTLDAKPVVGRGSQLNIDLGSEGALEGFEKKWNKVVESGIKPVFRTEAAVYDDVERQLNENIKGGVTITVQTPRLIYFGDDREFVQPAYFYTAVIEDPQAVGKAYYAGLVPALQNPPEPLLKARDAKTRELPGAGAAAPVERIAPMEKMRPTQQKIRPIQKDDPGVGRYVVRNDSWDWVDDANDFKRGLNSGHYSGLPAISFGDYYWDEPRFWTNQEDSFVDRWHVTLVEGHGAHWLFTTTRNCCDVVNLNASTQPGYGDRAGDSMRFLVLKGCSILPAPPDEANWAAPWWRIFKGLRQAVGFRTTMYINDDISDDFGYWIGRNCRVLDSWFYATNTSWSYRWNRFWGAEVTGYGAVVMIPGHEGDGIYHTAAAPPATSTGLTIYWQH